MISWEEIARTHGYVNADTQGDERALLEDLYHTQGLSLEALTKKLKVSRNALRSALTRLEIPAKKRGGANNQKFAVTDALLERVKEIGVKATATELGVSYTTLYKRLYQPPPKEEEPEL